MKAAVCDVAGEPEVLRSGDVPYPLCPADGLVIRVKAVSVGGGGTKRGTQQPPHAAYVAGHATTGEVV